MNKSNTIPIILIVGYITYQQFAGNGSPIAPKPAPPILGAEVMAAFSQTDNRQQAAADAKLLAYVCDTLAEILDTDGKLKEPQLSTGLAIDNLRRNDRIYTFQRRSLSTNYPALPNVISAHFEAIVGTSGGPIDDQQRAKWVKAFADLAKASHYAAGEL